MSIVDYWHEGVLALRESHIMTGLYYIGIALVVTFVLLLIVLGILVILKKFVHRDPVINRAHRITIYLLTLGGAVVLIFAGVLGTLLPLVPGFILIISGLLLLRKYHRWNWLDQQIVKLKARMHMKKKN